jgi:hypothetical protein
VRINRGKSQCQEEREGAERTVNAETAPGAREQRSPVALFPCCAIVYLKGNVSLLPRCDSRVKRLPVRYSIGSGRSARRSGFSRPRTLRGKAASE